MHPPASTAVITIRGPMRLALYVCMAGIIILGLVQQPFLHRALIAVHPLF